MKNRLDARRLIESSNRRRELDRSKTIYSYRNGSGIFVHAIFIRPFQWEMNREAWMEEELASIKQSTPNNFKNYLRFPMELMVKSGMIMNGKKYLSPGKDYPYEFKHGDLVKLAIVDHSYPLYPEFRDNDGTYVILRKSILEYDLGIFPLYYGFDVMGSIHQQIKFDGKLVYPDAYLNLIKGGEVCHCNQEFGEIIVKHLIPKVEYYHEHPIPLYNEDLESKNYGFICSKFVYGDCTYKFIIPFNLSISKLTLSTLKKAMKYRMNKEGFVCELIESKNGYFSLFIHDYILVRGSGVYRSEIRQNLWEYFHTYDPENCEDLPKLKDWVAGLKDDDISEIAFLKELKNSKLKSWSYSSLKRHGLRKSKENDLQFEMEDIFAHSYLSSPETAKKE